MNSNFSFSGQDGELASFVCRYLEKRGALLESRTDRMDLLLPGELAAALGVEEYISIRPGSDTADSPGHGRPLYPIHFGSQLLDKVSSMAGAESPLVEMELNFDYLKQGGWDNLIREQFLFHKIKGSVAGFGDIKTRYLILTCRFVAQSDEQKEGLVDLAVNMETGAVVPNMAQCLVGVEKNERRILSHVPSKEDIDRVMDLVGIYLPEAVEQELSQFKKSMNRRFARDGASLDDYYRALKDEMEDSLTRTGISSRLRSERKEKIALIPGELAAKQADLLNKYGIRIKISLAAAMIVTTPAVKVLFNAVSGKLGKSLSFIYNPVTKQMDPLVCAACGQSTYRIGLCRNLHLLCDSCRAGDCPLCKIE